MPFTTDTGDEKPIEEQPATGMFDDEPQPEGTTAPEPAMADAGPEAPEPPMPTDEAENPPLPDASTVAAEAAPVLAPVEVSNPPRRRKKSSTVSQAVKVGLTEGQLSLMPLADVLGLLLPELQPKILERAEVSPNPVLEKQMRDTEGRCAPVFFTQDEDTLSFFYGVDELAAACRLGFSDVYVISIANSDAGTVQRFLTDQGAKRQSQAPDDEMAYRLAAFYDDE